MTKIRFIGGEECGDVAFTDWGGIRFKVDQWVELDPQDDKHLHMIDKARGNRFFEVSDGVIQSLPTVGPVMDDLRAQAKDLGVRGWHQFKSPEKLSAAIDEALAS